MSGLEQAHLPEITASLLRWHVQCHRSFPWRDPTCPPFHVLVAELLLRKTRGEAVLPVWERLIDRYPTPRSIVSAELEELEELLRPIGLYRIRARALKDIGELLINQFGGEVPNDLEALQSLPHLGRYGANAVRCFAFDEEVGIVDGNVARIVGRLFRWNIPAELHKADEFWRIANELAREADARGVNLALLDLGSLVCVAGPPRCELCPIAAFCAFTAASEPA